MAVLLFAPMLFACEVPVFSYAMQHWNADPYRVSIFHNGPLSPEEKHLVEAFNAIATHESLETNLDVQVFDVEALTDAYMQALRNEHLPDGGTGVVVQYPMSSRKEQPIFAGPLSDALLRELVDSPVRSLIINYLSKGKVAVWVLLESGSRRADNTAAELLERELRRMEQVLQLPEVDVWAWSDVLRDAAEAGAGIRFPLVRVARDAPEEKLFIQMLLRSEPDLMDMEDAPIAFPIYGRGLILYALVGAGINVWNIADACEFIVGPCSCQAKASNPGTDLLLSANWSQHIGKTGYDKPAPLAGFSDFFERGEIAAARLAAEDAADDVIPIASGENDGKTLDATTHHARRYIWLMIGMLTGCIVAGIFFYATYTRIIGKENR